MLISYFNIFRRIAKVAILGDTHNKFSGVQKITAVRNPVIMGNYSPNL